MAARRTYGSAYFDPPHYIEALAHFDREGLSAKMNKARQTLSLLPRSAALSMEATPIHCTFENDGSC